MVLHKSRFILSHANPEFALGRLALTEAMPDRRFNMNAARAVMHRLMALPPADRTPAEHALVCRYQASLRQTRRVEAMQREVAHLHDRGGGMHGMGKAGERFVGPRRRFVKSGVGNV